MHNCIYADTNQWQLQTVEYSISGIHNQLQRGFMHTSSTYYFGGLSTYTLLTVLYHVHKTADLQLLYQAALCDSDHHTHSRPYPAHQVCAR